MGAINPKGINRTAKILFRFERFKNQLRENLYPFRIIYNINMMIKYSEWPVIDSVRKQNKVFVDQSEDYIVVLVHVYRILSTNLDS